MKKIILIILLLIIGGVIAFKIITKENYYKEISYNELKEMINNKESFVLVITQTTCSHCMSYKPKIKDIAKEYKVNTYYIEADKLSEESNKDFKKIFYYTVTPTTIFVKDGKELSSSSRINGDLKREKIIKNYKKNGFIKEAL